MPTLTLYHLHPYPQSSFHFGRRGVEQETTDVFLPSDSLFAALVAAYTQIGGDSDSWASRFPGDGAKNLSPAAPPFLLTSAFPRAGGVRFYPAPVSLDFLISRAKRLALEDEGRLKEAKKIQFISEKLFQKVLAGQRLDDYFPAKQEKEIKPNDKGLYLGGNLWIEAEEVKNLPGWMQKKRTPEGKLVEFSTLLDKFKALRRRSIWQTKKTPRVTIDRLTNASSIFHTGRLTFSQGCGLWFGIQWQPDSQQIQQQLEAALDILADSGLGAERATGYGHFGYEKLPTPLTLTDPTPGQPSLTLSRYHPANPAEFKEVTGNDNSGTAYKLVSVGGWLYSPYQAAQRRRRLWFVAEGAILQATASSTLGNITDVKPIYRDSEFPHPIWRYGVACRVGLKGGSQ